MKVRSQRRSRPQTMAASMAHVTVIAAVLFLSLCPGVKGAFNSKPPDTRGNTFDFAEVDLDGSGCVKGPIEKQKFRLYIGGILKDSLPMTDVERALQAGRITNSADINGDGKICECDLLTIFLTDSSANGKRRHAFRVFEDGSIFDSADSDGDGYLSDVTEKAGLTRKLAECVTDVKARTIVDAMSKLEKDDGKLARTEYMLFLNSPHHFPPIPRIPHAPLAHPSPHLSPGSGKMPNRLSPPPLHNSPALHQNSAARPVMPPLPALQPKPVMPPQPFQNNPRPVQSIPAPVLPSRPVWVPGPESVKSAGAQDRVLPVQSGMRPIQPPRPVYQPEQAQADPHRPVPSSTRLGLPPRPVMPSGPIQNQLRPVQAGYGPVRNEAEPVQKIPRPVQSRPQPAQRLLPPQSMLLSDGTRIALPQLPLAEDIPREGLLISPGTSRDLPHPPTAMDTRPQVPFPQPPSPILSLPHPPEPQIVPDTQAPSQPRVQAYPVSQQGPVVVQAPPMRQQPPPVIPQFPVNYPGYRAQANPVRQSDAEIQFNTLHQPKSVIDLKAMNQPGGVEQGNLLNQPTLSIAAGLVYPPRQRIPLNRPSGPRIQLDLENELNPLVRQRPKNPRKHFSRMNPPDHANRPSSFGRNQGRHAHRARPVQSPANPPTFQSVQSHSPASPFWNQPASPVRSSSMPRSKNLEAELDRQLQGTRRRPNSHWDAISQKIYDFIQHSRYKFGSRSLPSQKRQANVDLSNGPPVSANNKAASNSGQSRPQFVLQHQNKNQQEFLKPESIPAQQEIQTPSRISQLAQKLDDLQKKSEVRQAESQNHEQTLPASQSEQPMNEPQGQSGQPDQKPVPEKVGVNGLTNQQNRQPPQPELQNNNQNTDSSDHVLA